ncbi:ABC transporter ATP-binding protein [Paenibacillus crassostreae]|uniref:Spermidine/putrescine ABC transporter ATP-binding protein n=1 Tax=Paenibacillus crassostreae TaxID=1763538 RepID=A0A167FUW4_9BACL|nr:ABC transporter ATP-binding protein [Paenibacillus crassostreae]AOZ94037.1 spermidine/putrescine ABC transporter ATP-binding protein [Paenibacillus crassostreae]OAB76926.1 spermidine/putrescine ABC transporter ATP-binding protein [Paenibacillus crassostreae]
MIQLTNVTKKFVQQTAVKNISLTLPIGKIFGIVGENGSGKSTLLKLIAGLTLPTSGSVTVNGMTANRKISKIVSYLSEQDSFYSIFTVREAMGFQASQFPDFNIAKAEAIMKFMQLDPNKKIKDLSKGNRGRLKIVFSLARESPYILMDEPLSGLDPMVRKSIVKGMISFVDLESQTLIMTSHEITEIESILDSFIAIKDGSLITMSDVAELHESEGLGIKDWMEKTYV